MSGGSLPFPKGPLASSTAACAGKSTATDEMLGNAPHAARGRRGSGQMAGTMSSPGSSGSLGNSPGSSSGTAS